MKHLGLLFILVSFALQGQADIPYQRLWQKANQFYQQAQYDSAAHYYEQLAANQPENAEVYYNLGNTYYRMNQVGAAVLNYERALQREPGYSEAKDNLALAQSRISNRILDLPEIFFIQWWKALTKPSLSETWAITAFVFFLMTLVVLFMRRWQRPQWLPGQIVFITGFLFIVTAVMGYIAARHVVEQDRAVVMLQDAPLKEDPSAAKSLSLIPEGTVVRVEDATAEWVEVRLPDGRHGWMHSEAIEKI